MEATAETPARLETRMLLLVELHESPLNPRKHYAEKPLKELADNIARVGILSPLIVRPSTPSGRLAVDGYEIGAGHRRYRAARLAKLQEVPCIIRALDDTAFLELLTVENLQREDVHALDEGEGYRTLMEKAGYDVDTVAAKVGKSKSYVYQRLKLAELIPNAKKAFLADEVTAGHAVLIARLQPKDQAEAMKQIFDIDGYGYQRRARGEGPRTPCSVRELGGWIQQSIHLDLQGAPWKKDDAALVPAAGACTTCPKRTGFIPDLFPDISKKDTCTDRACFQAKAAAFVAGKVAAAEKAGEVLVPISSEYGSSGRKKDVLYGSQYSEVKPGSCPHARKAIIVEGRGLGQQRSICTDAKCTVHRGRSSFRDSPREQARQREAAAKQQRKELTRQRLHEAIRAKVTAPLPRPVLELVAVKYFDDIWHELRVKVMRLWGWIGKGGKAGSEAYGKNIRERLAKLTEDELARFLADLAVGHDLHAGAYDERGPDALHQMAKQYKVDAAKIEAAVTRELAEKRKVQQAKAKKQAKKKGNGKKKPAPAKKANPDRRHIGPEYPEPTCTGCGCTKEMPCIDGDTGEACSWAKQPDKHTNGGLCSACAPD